MDTRYRKEAGDQGEALALQHLQLAGLKLQARNYRAAGGEIDLVMLDQQVLVFVEVRFRRDSSFGGAAASVTAVKQKRLLRAAQHFLQTHAAYRHYRARFDLVAIDGADAETQVSWIRNAFTQ